MKSKLFLILIATLFISCKKTHDEFGFYPLLIDKEWNSQNGMESVYTFKSNSEYVYVRTLGVINPETNVVTEFKDTVNGFWKLNNDVLMFSRSSTFTNPNPLPTDWCIIELNNNILKIKYLCDIENPYILPFIFESN